jgi:hypothetical protein
MKKTLTFLLIMNAFLMYSQESEEYIDGRLIKTQAKEGILVSTSLRAIQRNDGKYYTFDVSVSNSSQKTKTVKVNDFKAQIVNHKEKKEDLNVLSNKEYQDIKQKRGSFRAGLTSLVGSFKAEKAGTSVSQTNTNVSGSSSTSGSARVNASNSNGAYAQANGNYSGRNNTNINAKSTTVSYNGAAAYEAQQNEERKLNEFMILQQEAKNRWNDMYIKSNTLSPLESMSGLLNVEYKKGELIELSINVEDINFLFKWLPEDSEK